jgi:hypothetical protein
MRYQAYRRQDTANGILGVGSGCHDALTELDRIIMNVPVNFVVDMDISKFFWTLPLLWNERQFPYATELLPSGR